LLREEDHRGLKRSMRRPADLQPGEHLPVDHLLPLEHLPTEHLPVEHQPAHHPDASLLRARRVPSVLANST